jgi:large repetitive protein
MEATNYTLKGRTLFARVLFLSFFATPLISSHPLSASPIRDSIVAASKVNVSCNGGNNGSASLGVKGGTAPYTYSWSPNVSSSASATGLSAGTYSITVMDVLGNSGSMAVLSITQPAAIRDSIATNTGVGCNGGNGGAAKVGVKGGSMPYTYLWSNGSTLATASSLSAGNYSVRVTDKNGCNNTVDVTITQPNAISDNLASLTNPSCNGGFGSAFINISGGTAPYTFTWTRGVSTSASATNLIAGSYTVSVKDAHSCSGTTLTFTLTQPLAIRDSMIAADKVNVTCNGGNNGSATVAAKYGTPPYTYSWNPNVSASASASGLSAGTYSVTVTDNNGCSSSAATVTITQPGTLRDSVAAQVNVGCNGGNGGGASIGVKYGKAPYTFSWAPNTDNTYTASGLTAGTYSVTVTDNNGCSSTLPVTITEPLAIRDSLATISYPACHGSTGMASLGVKYGTAPYTYNWSPAISSSASATNIMAGTYTVTIKDAHSCSALLTFTVTQPAALNITIASHSNGSCGSTGSATANPATGGSSPYTYSWAPGGYTTLTISGLSANTYTVTATDNNGCSASSSVIISAPNPIRDSVTNIINPLCSYGTGSVTLGVKYGTAPFTYLWNNGSSTLTYMSNQAHLLAGTYTATITDINGCTAIAHATVNAPTPILAGVSVLSNVNCHGDSTGSIIASPSGGVSPYTYLWSDASASSTATISNLSIGTYIVSVTDNNGCNTIDSAIITSNSLVDSIVSQTGLLCYGGEATVTVGVRGGTSPYNYFWGPYLTTASNFATNLIAGVLYNVNITDAGGCSSTLNFTLTQPALLTDSVGSVSCSSNLITASLITNGGTAPYTYSWSPGGETQQEVSGLTPGMYTITVTDANGCNNILTTKLSCSEAENHRKDDKNNTEIQCCRDIVIYPNPTSGLLTITGLLKGQIIEMYDYTGRMVSSITVTETSIQSDITDQPDGIYLIRILSNNGTLVNQKKVVKTQ